MRSREGAPRVPGVLAELADLVGKARLVEMAKAVAEDSVSPLTAAQYELVEVMASEGKSEADMAKALRIGYGSQRAWQRLKVEDELLSDALWRGRGAEETELVARLKAGGKNVVGSIFLLKCRHNYCDTPPPAAPPPTVAIFANFQALEQGEYQARLEARRALPAGDA